MPSPRATSGKACLEAVPFPNRSIQVSGFSLPRGLAPVPSPNRGCATGMRLRPNGKLASGDEWGLRLNQLSGGAFRSIPQEELP